MVGVSARTVGTASVSKTAGETSAAQLRIEDGLDSPFLNVKPGVGYVGDAACAGCHAAIAESYSRHPMGRSMAHARGEEEIKAGERSFSAQGFDYSVDDQGDTLIIKEARRDKQGHTSRTPSYGLCRRFSNT